jgi:hypothetical protein
MKATGSFCMTISMHRIFRRQIRRKNRDLELYFSEKSWSWTLFFGITDFVDRFFLNSILKERDVSETGTVSVRPFFQDCGRWTKITNAMWTLPRHTQRQIEIKPRQSISSSRTTALEQFPWDLSLFERASFIFILLFRPHVIAQSVQRRARRRGFDSWQCKICFLSVVSDRLSRPPIILSDWYRQGKVPWASSWPLSSKCRGQEWWSYTSTPPYVFVT